MGAEPGTGMGTGLAPGLGRARAARRLAAAAAYGGGGLGVVGGSLFGLLRLEASLARRAIGAPSKVPPPDPTGWYGHGRGGPAVRMAVLGDSSAAGYGVDRVEDTPGAHLASDLSERAARRVHLETVAVVGARSADLDSQVTRVLTGTPPDVAVVLIGANDVTHAVRPAVSVRYLAEAVQALRESGVAVVVGTCPDLGTLTPVAWPLRQVAREWSRRMAAAQTIATVEQGGRTVSMGSILGPEFRAAPGELFGPDRFHPSAAGYRAMVAVLLPSVLAALDVVVGAAGTNEAEPSRPAAAEVLPITAAALRAVDLPGTELDGSELLHNGAAGRRTGVRGRWVQLRHRRRHPHSPAEAPRPEESGVGGNDELSGPVLK